VPVYLGAAKLLANYPVSVITDGQGLNITVVGYLGQLHFGLVACRELVPTWTHSRATWSRNYNCCSRAQPP
jgi:hypothetical protein